MLGKLLKYDFRSMWKQFSVIWPAALILAFINRFTMFGAQNSGANIFGEWTAFISMTLFVGVCIAMAIVSAVFVLTRFYKGLLGDEGYLMNTLPVPTWQLVLSKLVCALVTTIGNGLVGILAMFLMMPLDWNEVFDARLWQTLFRGIAQHPDTLLYFLEFCLMLVGSAILMFTTLYLSMAIGHLFSKHRILMSVAAFFALDILGSLLLSSMHYVGALDWLYGMDLSSHAALWLSFLSQMLPAAVMFLITCWILKNRLNLE